MSRGRRADFQPRRQQARAAADRADDVEGDDLCSSYTPSPPTKSFRFQRI